MGAIAVRAGPLVAAAAACVLLLLAGSRLGGGPRALLSHLRGARLHSVGYYENLAAADSWDAGPAGADAHIRRGRTQLLAQIQSRRLGHRGRALVKLCSEGNNEACEHIASDPRELRALQSQEAAQKQRAQQLRLRRETEYKPDPQMMARVVRAANSMANQEALQYQDNADAKNIWDASNWQSGKLGDVVSNQWLAACGQGNSAACSHIAQSNGALQALLTSSSTPGPPIEAYMPSPAPKPVYVAAQKPKAKPGMLSDVMDFLGLGDNYDQSNVRKVTIPKMVPDQGFHKGPKYSAVWNDGTIAPELSDNANSKKFYRDAGKMLKMNLDFSDTVQAKPQRLWKQ